MKYGFLNNKFVLVKYVVKHSNVEEYFLTDKQLEKFTANLEVEYTVETIDNSTIEWLLNYEINSKDIEKAIELGEIEYKKLIYSTDYSAKIAELELFNSELLLQNANLTIANTQNETDIATLTFQMAMSLL